MDKRLKFNEPWILQRADPYVYEKDGWYYFTASVPAYDSIVLRRAKKLADLPQAEEVVIWKKHESGPMSKHIWAPELHYLEGKWYIYFAGGEEEDIWKIRPYVLECQGQDPLADAWVEKGKMQRADGDEFSFEAFSLDATVFEDAGDYYYVWAEKVGVGKQISNLYIAKMESPCKLATVQVLLTTPDYDWERVGFWVNEGPAVIHHGDKLYLTYSASDTGVAYCVGMLTATSGTDLLDPLNWRKERHPVLQSSYEKGIYGPGHNSFTKDEDGNDLPKTVISREYSSEWKLGDEPYYPVNDEKNAALYAQYKELADAEPNVIFGGRLGEYKYYDMDKVIEAALKCVEKEFN